ncbi:MAG: DUF1292 domain-containing protein [Erysipelotrichaceae bacterium]|nr:DUF1292 domain-containing protein [Erysipelotrichaceae bacterium]
MKTNETFKVIKNDGQEIECEVLFTFNSEETGKSYVVYTDNIVSENGKVQAYANTYDSMLGYSKLGPIENEHEWMIIEMMFNSLQNNSL